MYKAHAVPGLPAKVSGSASDWPASGLVRAIVKVKVPDHVPAGVTVRSRVDGMMFTGEFAVDELPHIAADPSVESIAAARPMPSI